MAEEILEQLTAIVPLAHGQSLAVEKSGDGSVLRLLAPDGNATLSIVITPTGPVLKFGGAGLAIEAEGDIGVSARRLALHGREGVVIATGGDLEIHADRDLTSTARIQTIIADRGNVNVRANDDVKLDGERVLVNCDC